MRRFAVDQQDPLLRTQIGSGINDTEWIYGYGDVVFVVHAPDAKQAAAFLEALP